MCVRVNEDSIWTVPSLPVGKGTTWLYVHHSLTSDLSGSHMHQPRYLHIGRYACTASQPAVLRDWCSYTERERRNERRACFLRLPEPVWNSLRLFWTRVSLSRGNNTRSSPHRSKHVLRQGISDLRGKKNAVLASPALSGHQEHQSKQSSKKYEINGRVYGTRAIDDIFTCTILILHAF